MVQLQCIQRSVFKLIGTDEKPKYDSAEGENILATNNSVMTSHYFQKAYISFMFRLYDDSKHYTEKYLDCIVSTWANLLLSHAFHAFYIGLVSFWVARKSREEQSWYQRGNKSKLALKKWTESSQWSFENKWYLLEAEESFCNNDFDAAKSYYDKAISSAKDHKVRWRRTDYLSFSYHCHSKSILICVAVSHQFVHEEALAYELAGYFYLELGDIDQCVEYFLHAHERYQEWVSRKSWFPLYCDILYNQLLIVCLGLILYRSTQREHLENATVCSSSLRVLWESVLFKVYQLPMMMAMTVV